MQDHNWPPKLKYRMFNRPKRKTAPHYRQDPFSFWKEAFILSVIIAFIIGFAILAVLRIRL